MEHVCWREMLYKCMLNVELMRADADAGCEWYTSCSAGLARQAVGQAVSQQCISLSLVTHSQLLPFHGRINNSYNIQIVKGTLHPLRSWSSGRTSL
jgi:hypothetical protein